MTPHEVINRIIENGFEAYIVGGYVRDYILKIESKDIDIATNAKYNDLLKIFRDTKTDQVGKNFQVLMVDGTEVATYRKDLYDDVGNQTGTTVVNNINDDLSRRDLTINSMAMHPITKEIIDPFNGKNDIKHRIVRFTGNSEKRVMEDPVRMLRACRFLSLMKTSIFDIDTFNTIQKHHGLLKNVPKERIRLEVIKAMKSKTAGNFFRALANTNLLQHVFPSMINAIGHDGGIHHNETIFEHCVMAVDNVKSSNPLLKIAAFLHDVGKPLAFKLCSNGSFRTHDRIGVELTKQDLINLKFSNEEIRHITSLIELHMVNFTLDSSDRTVRRLVVKLNERKVDVEDMIKLIIADNNSNMKKIPHDESMFKSLLDMVDRVMNKESAFSIKDLKIDGNDVMDHFNIGPGPKVGSILKALFEMVLDDPGVNTKENLLNLLNNYKEVLDEH